MTRNIAELSQAFPPIDPIEQALLRFELGDHFVDSETEELRRPVNSIDELAWVRLEVYKLCTVRRSCKHGVICDYLGQSTVRCNSEGNIALMKNLL